MTLLENRKEHLISQDEMKVMIAHDHAHHCLTRRLDDEDTWDELASEVKRVAESSAEAMRNIEERHAEMQASIASLNQCINALKKKYQE